MILVLRSFKIRDDKEDSPLTSGIDLFSTSDQYRPYSNFTKCEEASHCNVAKRGQTMALKAATLSRQSHCFIDREPIDPYVREPYPAEISSAIMFSNRI
jgi:hypothetical protein